MLWTQDSSQLILTPSAHLLSAAETQGSAGTNGLEQVGCQAGQRLSESDLSSDLGTVDFC